jgi:hypothetical protein
MALFSGKFHTARSRTLFCSPALARAFWNWYFHAKDKDRLLKPENKEELPQDPDAPKCNYHAFSGEHGIAAERRFQKKSVFRLKGSSAKIAFQDVSWRNV